jgi:hypothetical protein
VGSGVATQVQRRNASDTIDDSDTGTGGVFNYTVYAETIDLEATPEIHGAVVSGGGNGGGKRILRITVLRSPCSNTDRSCGILLSTTSMRTWITTGALAGIVLVTVHT